MEECADCGRLAECEQYCDYVYGLPLSDFYWVCPDCSYTRQRLAAEKP